MVRSRTVAALCGVLLAGGIAALLTGVMVGYGLLSARSGRRIQFVCSTCTRAGQAAIGSWPCPA